MIVYKTEREIELMAEAGAILRGVTDRLQAACVKGTSTIELDTLGERLIRETGARPGFLGYQGFEHSICVSINDEAVHGIPGPRRLEEGDIVSLDLGLVLNGFWADMGVTVPVGRISKKAARLIQITRESLNLGIERAVPGGHVHDISAAIQKHVEAAGFSVIRQFVGHGIGRDMHELPHVPNFGIPGTGPRLRPGMTLAIEPMVNAGTHEVYVKPDKWTVCTRDGELSAYFEHTVAITEDGPRVLTGASPSTIEAN